MRGEKTLPLIEFAEESSTNTIIVSPSAKERDVRLRVEGSRPYGISDTLKSPRLSLLTCKMELMISQRNIAMGMCLWFC